jgi:polyisoprenyl-teichoic acid--peptidoglycan teichoic acid transferase
MDDFQKFTKGARGGRWWRWLLCLPVGVLAAVLIVVSGAWGSLVPMEMLGYGAEAQVSRSGEESGDGWVRNLLAGEPAVPDGPINVLVLGVDERPQNEEMGTRTDTIMLVQLDPEGNQIKLLSVPRDLFVEIEPGKKDRINAAYSYGGIEQTVDALAEYAQVPIDHYAVVDFEGFEEVVDAMGGVEVEVEPGEFPEKWHFEEGIDRLNGPRALFYARYRGTAGGDLDRMERQRDLVAALRSKALSWKTARRLPEIIKIMDENVQTDLGVDEAYALANVLISEGRHDRVTSDQLKGTPETLENGNQVLIPDEQANEAILLEFRY